MHPRLIHLWIALALTSACAPDDDPRPSAQRTTTRLGGDDAGPLDDVPAAHALPCPDGGDCHAAPARAEETDRCGAAERTACPCPGDARPVACDVDTDGPVTPATCYIGQRDCEAGAWSRCRPYRDRFR